ncbi:hypothetical protein [Microterricola pindariensis]|uniref:DUF5655 domain-containing protein n=1 Tax=Microterricola pindariensis TaxID=478010 RepID=A0ABX5AXF8_9MICO|nr:hypothetical protein [Microterricola pindariensis]PPL19214.1 hypothetical protein GY24_07075 [Microterricola pindariensis]
MIILYARLLLRFEYGSAMNGELVFTVNGATATAAIPIGLAQAGLKERQHLQEWVIAHPEVLGSSIKIVAFEFGSWTGHTGEKERDRLDVLALDGDGHLIVVELKRDKAPDTVEMQALKYAALVSRFTRDDLDRVHARYRTQTSGHEITASDAAAELDAWAEITEDSLRLPKIVLMATDFPQTVTATVVFLHQQLGLDIKLLVFQAYQTANDVLVTVSQHYPPPGIEEFVLSPEVNEAQKAKTGKQNKQREANTVARLIRAEALEQGERFRFRTTTEPDAGLEEWFAEEPARRYATWQEDSSLPLVWQADAQPYSPTGLARLILEQGASKTVVSLQGPAYWVNDTGESLVDIANNLPEQAEVPVETHTDRMSAALLPLWEHLDESILALSPEVSRQSRVRGLKYYGNRKLCDISVHSDHLSVYIQGLNFGEYPATTSNTIVSGRSKYIHAQLKSAADHDEILGLLQKGLASQQN